MGHLCNLNNSILFFGTNNTFVSDLHKNLSSNTHHNIIQVEDDCIMATLLPSQCLKIIDYPSTKKWVKENLSLIHDNQLNIIFTNTQPNEIAGIVHCFDSKASLEEIISSIKLKLKSPKLHNNYHSTIFNLTPKEKLVYSMIMEGKSNKEIAGCICRSIHTVKTHIYNLYQKLDVNNRVQAINKSYYDI